MRQNEHIFMSISGRVFLKLNANLCMHIKSIQLLEQRQILCERSVVEDRVALPVQQMVLLAQLFRTLACPGDQHVLKSARLRVNPQLGKVTILK